ncbi:ATP-dependent zinc metalloprotease FtsH [Saprospira sp. CCB-QB6]|uniref:ATP-dependent zinc metalloprotease FtsH n=1 Tax=Saprospira sp. CCB-QB6 TaxID=3023936 RepID=UPI00234A8C87|nr:ATP-dependent zinc metalloprotease FtsH [Saprospira sp. CCB-QB6]WCL82418.1 ATP-dependent zinc metalloprotease FtsH [Saprospira sp. CCB-QB6]
MQNNPNNQPQGDKNNGPKFNYYWIYGLLALLLISVNLIWVGPKTTELSWNELEPIIAQKDVDKIIIVNKSQAEIYLTEDALKKEEYSKLPRSSFNNNAPNYSYTVGDMEYFLNKLDNLEQKIAQDDPNFGINLKNEIRYDYVGGLLSWILPFAILIIIWIFIMRRVGGGGAGPGSQIFNIGRSKATLFDKDGKVNASFKDVAGLDEAKEEVMEVVDFLKKPKKYTSLGGKIPKGVLLVGPPGTGKTLLAKAVAGEAGVPFFSISGSDFVEMFVGVGASRVRDLFRQAREKAPCIIFIDEIDAIGRARGRGAMQGGNDERENTLNQLLVEMDGFSTEKGVIMMAATNRPDILDQALLRPGRFDRQISIDKPDLVGREQIFAVHLKNIKISGDVDAKNLATQTPGFAGAEIANVCNEAALIAARRGKQFVEMNDFNDAIDRVIGGLEKKNKLISPEEKRVIAYHEAGHTLCGWFLENAMPLVKVTIVPRGIAALGYAQYLPKEQHITTVEQLLDRMCMTMGGRAAEEIIFGKISTGAQSDLDHVTRMAYSMITVYGMNEKVGNVSYYGMMNESGGFSKPYSEATADLIDQETRKLIEAQYERAKNLLREKRQELELLANELLNKEVLNKDAVEQLIGKRPFDELPGEDGEAVSENHGVDTLQDPKPELGEEDTEEKE